MNEQVIAHTYKRILFLKKEGNPDICYNMGTLNTLSK
jgi:hypothetical protein